MDGISKKAAIQGIVKSSVKSYASGFEARHLAQVDNPNGTINMKVHNPFIAALGAEVQYYSALVRSLDSSLGDMLEQMAIAIAELSYIVNRRVEGPLSADQTSRIAALLERYKRRVKSPEIDDYADLGEDRRDTERNARHDSDYYLQDRENGHHHLIELKIGGDLDNKKARSEKEALLEQYAILCNTLPDAEVVRIHFATAYNRFGEGRPWTQSRVLQYFAPQELLIGEDFWNFVCKSDDGYTWVLDEYRSQATEIIHALENVKMAYLP